MSSAESVPAGRIHSLDGVRGVASLAVVFYHLTLIMRTETSAEAWAWLTESPLKILYPGTEAVLVFFALSGLVVALPALRPGFSWVRYYPARLLRLYLPVVAALVLSTALILLIPRDATTMPDGSWMRDAQATTVSPWSFLSEASLLQESYDIDNVLWSLRWELFFSLLLPLFVGLALWAKRWSVVLAVVAMAATVTGRVLDVDVLVYYPVFLLGTIVAVNLDAIAAWSTSVRFRRAAPWLAVLACLLLIASWLARPVVEYASALHDTLWGLAGVGAIVVIVLAVAWPPGRAALERRVPQWLGRISFSLYLVHAPILGTLAYLFGVERWWLAGLVGIPVSLVAGWLFHRYVETPTQRFARAAGNGAASLARRALRLSAR